MVFSISLLGCFDFWALNLTNRGYFSSSYRKVLWPGWWEARKFCWSLDLKCFMSSEIFLLTFMSINSFLQKCFCKTQTLLWLKLILYSQSLLEKGPTAGCGPAPGSPCWHLHRALGFLWASEQVCLFNCLCKAGLLKSHPRGTLRGTSCSFFLCKALYQCGRQRCISLIHLKVFWYPDCKVI